MLLKIFIGYYVIIAVLFIAESLHITLEATLIIKNRNVKLKKDKTTALITKISIIKLIIYSILPIFRLIMLFAYWTRRDEIIEDTVDEVIELRGVKD